MLCVVCVCIVVSLANFDDVYHSTPFFYIASTGSMNQTFAVYLVRNVVSEQLRISEGKRTKGPAIKRNESV